MIVKERCILYLYLLLWFMYELQGLFWTEGNIFSLAIIMMLTMISFVYVVKVNIDFRERPLFFTSLNLLLIMFTIYGILFMIEGPRFSVRVKTLEPYIYLKAIYNSLLPLYLFYYFARKGILTHALLQKLAILFFFMAIASFLHYEENAKLAYLNLGIEKEHIVNYKCYAMLSLFAVLSVYHKYPWVQCLGIICLMSFIFFGMKRGAILIGFGCTVWYAVELTKRAMGKRSLWVVMVLVVTIVILACLVGYLLETNELFMKRYQLTVEGNTSGRDLLFHAFYYHFIYNTDAWQFFFGSGAYATLSVSINTAHNDWLELAINQGVLGLSLYLFFWYSFFRSWKLMDRNHYTNFTFGLLILICFLKTFFSRTYSDMDIYTTCMLGYCLGTIKPVATLKS